MKQAQHQKGASVAQISSHDLSLFGNWSFEYEVEKSIFLINKNFMNLNLLGILVLFLLFLMFFVEQVSGASCSLKMPAMQGFNS